MTLGKKITSLILVFSLILSMSIPALAADETDNRAEVTLQAAASTFSVTLPTVLPVNIDAAGAVTVADDVSIKNYSVGPIEVTAVSVEPIDNWELTDFADDFSAKPIDSNVLGLHLQGADIPATGIADISGFEIINGGASLPLTYDAKVTARTIATKENVANVLFTVGWHSATISGYDIVASGNADYDLLVGQQLQLEAVAVYSRMSTIPTWTSSDDNVATVSDTGLVTAVKDGVATITYQNGELSESVDVAVKYGEVTITDENRTDAGFEGTDDEDLVIPETVIKEDGSIHKVTEIGDAAFKDTDIGSVTIPDTVTNIGDEAFADCDNLDEIILGNGIEEIGDNAFAVGTETPTIVVGGNDVTDSYDWESDGREVYRAVTSIEVTNLPNKTEYIVGESFEPDGMVVTATYAEGDTAEITDYEIVDGTNLSVGDTKIVIKYTNISGDEVTDIIDVVVRLPLTGISLNKTNVDLGLGATDVLYVIYSPEDTTDNKDVIWISSEPTVVSVDNGTITALAEGEAIITAKVGAFVATSSVSVKLAEFTITQSNRAKVGYTGAANEELVIPSTFQDTDGTWYKVTGVSNLAFNGCKSLASVTLPDSIVSIGDRAFMYCPALTTVVLPETLTNLGDSVFEDCAALVSITIPNGVKSLGDGMFSDCYMLSNVVLPSGLESIGDSAFSGCESLEQIDIPVSVKAIGAKAFANCQKFTDVAIPNGVNSLGDYVFASCTSLRSIVISNSVESIGSNAFQYCEALENVTLSSNLDSVSEGMFRSCYNLISISIPSGVKGIGDNAFISCGLTTINIPSSVTDISSSAFQYCNDMNAINVAAGNTAYSSADGVLFNVEKTTLMKYPPAKADASYAIPSGVLRVEESAFYGCDNLTAVDIPSSVTSIGGAAFASCEGLTSIDIPDGVTELGDSMFLMCRALESATLPSGISSIPASLFSACSALKSVSIPSGVTTIDSHAFSGCVVLPSIIIPYGVTTIEDSAFENCAALTRITIPNSVTTLGASALSSCDALKAATLSESLTSISSRLFAGCTALESITIPNGVTSIESNAFQGCTALKSATIPASVTSIAFRAFYYCGNLATLNFNHGTNDIITFGTYVFSRGVRGDITVNMLAGDNASIRGYNWSGDNCNATFVVS